MLLFLLCFSFSPQINCKWALFLAFNCHAVALSKIGSYCLMSSAKKKQSNKQT